MSDPVVNIEIEDVLASIRRLVTEGEAPRDPARKTAEVAPEAAQEEIDGGAESVSIASTSAEIAVSQPYDSANTPSAPDKLVLSADLMVEKPAEAEADEGPLLLTPAAGATEEGEPSSESESAEDPSAGMPEPPEGMWHTIRRVPEAEAKPEGRSDLLSTIAELEAAVDDTHDDFEPDGSEATPVVDWEKTTANGAIFGARAATTRIVDLVRPEPEPEGEAGDAESVAAPEPEPELAVFEGSSDGFEAETDDAEPVGDETEPELATISEEITAAVLDTETDSVVTAMDDTLSEFMAAETTLDEAALREMVVDIVRSELQGALGERITRNVRKLVRREIHRVLSSDEFN